MCLGCPTPDSLPLLEVLDGDGLSVGLASLGGSSPSHKPISLADVRLHLQNAAPAFVGPPRPSDVVLAAPPAAPVVLAGVVPEATSAVRLAPAGAHMGPSAAVVPNSVPRAAVTVPASACHGVPKASSASVTEAAADKSASDGSVPPCVPVNQEGLTTADSIDNKVPAIVIVLVLLLHCCCTSSARMSC